MNDEKIFEGLAEETKQVSQSIERLKKSLNGLANASSSLDALTTSLKNLKTVSNSLEKLTGVIGGLSSLTPELNAFRTAIRYLNRLNEPLKNLTATFEELKTSTKFVKQFKKDLDSLGKTSTIPDTTSNTAAKEIKKVVKETNNSTKSAKQASNAFKNLEKRFISLGRIFSVGGIIYGFRRFSSVLGKSFKLSNDYIEVLNLFTVALGDSFDTAQEVVQSWQKVLGLDPSQAMERWGSFRLLLQGFGDSSEQWETAITSMSQNLTQLSYDFASLYNVDPEIAMTKLQSAMSGMTRPLRTWGIDVSTPSLEVFAKRKGIEKSVHLMSQAEKAQLRYLLIMEKTSDVMMGIQGDLAKTLLTPGNAIRILKQQLVQLGRAFGDFIAPIISTYIPYVVAFVKGLTQMFVNLSKVMDDLTGYVRITAEDFKKVSENMDSVGGATEDAADATEEYSDALHGLLNGIDKFNVLSKGMESIGGDMFLSDDDLETYDFFKGLKDASIAILEQLQPAFDKAEEKITSFMKKVKELGITLEDIKNVIMAIIALKVAGVITEVIMGVSKLTQATKTLATAQIVSKTNLLAMTAGLAVVIYAGYQLYKLIKDLIENWDNLTAKEKMLKIFLGAVALGFVAVGSAIFFIIAKASLGGLAKALVSKVIPALKSTALALEKTLTPSKALLISVAALAVGIGVFIKNSKDMGPLQKLITIFTSLAVAAATFAIGLKAIGLGVRAALTGAAIAAGITLAVGSIFAANAKKKFAAGGFIGGGELFIAGERGPEWVGKQGASSVIVNDAQMSDIMYKSVKDGVIDALIRTDGGSTKVELNFSGMDKNDLARVMLRPIINEAKRQGYKLERS